MTVINKILKWLHGLNYDKGGHNDVFQFSKRSPPPKPFRRSILPESHLDIPMPSNVKPPRQICKHCGR